jgi:hypothetical protein
MQSATSAPTHPVRCTATPPELQMIIPNVSRHTITQLHQQLAQAGVNEGRELRSNGGCGLKLKKEGERGLGYGRAAHRAAAWSRFERVIQNTFAPRGVEFESSAYALAKQMTASLRMGEQRQQPLRLRHVIEVSRFAATFQDPAGNAAAALAKWPNRHQVAEPARAAPRAPVALPRIATPRTPISPEAAAILAVCSQTVGNEPDLRANQPAIAAPRAMPQPMGDPVRPGRQVSAGQTPANAAREPVSPQAQRMLEWCDRTPLGRDRTRTRTVVHLARPVGRVPVTAVRPDPSPPCPQERGAPTFVPPATASMPVRAAYRRRESLRAEVPSVKVAPAPWRGVEGLTPEHVSVIMTALHEDPDWDPADSRGFQKLWANYQAIAKARG